MAGECGPPACAFSTAAFVEARVVHFTYICASSQLMLMTGQTPHPQLSSSGRYLLHPPSDTHVFHSSNVTAYAPAYHQPMVNLQVAVDGNGPGMKGPLAHTRTARLRKRRCGRDARVLPGHAAPRRGDRLDPTGSGKRAPVDSAMVKLPVGDVTSNSRCSCRAGMGRPAPGRRTRPGGAPPESSSRSPVRMVGRDNPVASDTNASPPEAVVRH